MEDDDTDLKESTLKDEEISFVDGSHGQSGYNDSKTAKNEDVPDVRIHLECDELTEESDTMESEATDSAYKDSNQQMNHRHRLSSSERSNTLADDLSYIPPPKVNCPEKIVICVDASADMDKLTFRSRAGDKFSPKHLTKKGLSIFLQSKSKIDRKHEFALMLLREGTSWVRDFSNNPRDILVALDDTVESDVCESCNMDSVFDKILEKIDQPTVQGDVSIQPPLYTIRLILIYGRSNCPLELSKKESFNLLNSSPYFFLDVIYIHEPPNEENQCQTVFDSICDLDQTGQSYIFGVNRNQTKLYSHMAQLLAHPLQRPLQNDASYRIGSSVPQTENG